MSDVIMCRNEDCTIKDQCLRQTAIPGPMWQEYAFYVQNPDGTCVFYLPEDFNSSRKPAKRKLVEVKRRTR